MNSSTNEVSLCVFSLSHINVSAFHLYLLFTLTSLSVLVVVRRQQYISTTEHHCSGLSTRRSWTRCGSPLCVCWIWRLDVRTGGLQLPNRDQLTTSIFRLLVGPTVQRVYDSETQPSVSYPHMVAVPVCGFIWSHYVVWVLTKLCVLSRVWSSLQSIQCTPKCVCQFNPGDHRHLRLRSLGQFISFEGLNIMDSVR